MKEKKAAAPTLNDDQIAAIRSEAVRVVQMHLRAEAKAQATIAKREMSQQLNHVLDDDRKRLEAVLSLLESKIDRLSSAGYIVAVNLEVLKDMLMGGETAAMNGDAETVRRAAFLELCKRKQLELEVKGQS